MNRYATTSPAGNQTRTVQLGTFGFDSTIPTDATITGVTVSVEWKVSTTSSIATLGAGAYVSGVPIGTELVNAAEPLSDTTQSFAVAGLTRAQLLDGTFQVRVRATRGNSDASFTARLDAVSVKVDYTTPGPGTLTSDANGNLVAKGTDTFGYDQANRLTSATVAGATETYTYDGDGVRFSRTVGAGPAIRYVSDLNTSLPVTIEDGTRKYVWGLGLAYAVSGASVEIHHTDGLGSVRAITDASGAVIATYRTDEFGVPAGSTGATNQPFRYTGEPLDASGLTYLRARYYDPTLGRFLSRDTWPGAGWAPSSLNRYAYVDNNPTGFADPSGRIGPAACLVPPVAFFCGKVAVAAAEVAVFAGTAVIAAAATWVVGSAAGDVLVDTFKKPPNTVDPIPEPRLEPDTRHAEFLDNVLDFKIPTPAGENRRFNRA